MISTQRAQVTLVEIYWEAALLCFKHPTRKFKRERMKSSLSSGRGAWKVPVLLSFPESGVHTGRVVGEEIGNLCYCRSIWASFVSYAGQLRAL